MGPLKQCVFFATVNDGWRAQTTTPIQAYMEAVWPKAGDDSDDEDHQAQPGRCVKSNLLVGPPQQRPRLSVPLCAAPSCECCRLTGRPELQLRVLSEAVPMQQFQHLLKKRDYVRAEAFARMHRMDMQVRRRA